MAAGQPGVKYSDMLGRKTEKMVVSCCQNY